MNRPLVNSWTEFGTLEYICLGLANGELYPEYEPFYISDRTKWDDYDDFITAPSGPRPAQRLNRAKQELEFLREILEGECVSVATVSEFEKDVKEDLIRKRTFLETPKDIKEDKRIRKQKIEVCRPPYERVDYSIRTPWFKNKSQVGLACPRDLVITLGNTILETATAYRGRYFDSFYFRDIIYKHFDADDRIHWKTAPKPTCSDSMLHYIYEDKRPASIKRSGTALNEKEVAFDAADMVRIGKDVFYKRSASANYKGLRWLRKEFKDLRFHAMHFQNDFTPHIDVNLIPMRPPTAGSNGIVLINQNHPPVASEMQLFIDNDWELVFGPKPTTNKVSPVAVCSPNLNLNLLCLSPKCCIIEECEVPLYNQLEELGFDVITCPFRTLNEYGGGIHCDTWDIRRDDECKDYFPNQNYEEECKKQLFEPPEGNWYTNSPLNTRK